MFSELYKIMVNKVTFVGFRGDDGDRLPGSVPEPDDQQRFPIFALNVPYFISCEARRYNQLRTFLHLMYLTRFEMVPLEMCLLKQQAYFFPIILFVIFLKCFTSRNENWEIAYFCS